MSNTPSWSAQQRAIFHWFGTSEVANDFYDRLIVRARAGTGKTTTIIEGISHAPEKNILLCAFNKRIADELTARLSNRNAQAKTLHAIGFACVRRFWSGIRIADGSDRADALTNLVCKASSFEGRDMPQAPDAIKRLVSKLHTKAREMAPHARRMGELTAIAEMFECEPDETWEWEGWTTRYVESKALEAMELAAAIKPITGIDFADMIFLPVRNRWTNPVYDLVVVDEAQDMTVAQLEIARGVCRGRICIVGDDRQAIYAFRGADSDSLDRLKEELGAAELGLTTTYRCGRRIVEMAKKIVPDFEAGIQNTEGEILPLKVSEIFTRVEPGCFILSRTNAPLVPIAMKLLRNGKRARIAGRDIGAGLKTLVRKIGRGNPSIEEFISRVIDWRDAQVAQFAAAGKEAKVELVRDQAEMLVDLAGEAGNTTDLVNRIDVLFTDDTLGQAGVITCSSVHRSKGLEADYVFVLTETLRAHNTEELNIQYVAFTRAKHVLGLVAGK